MGLFFLEFFYHFLPWHMLAKKVYYKTVLVHYSCLSCIQGQLFMLFVQLIKALNLKSPSIFSCMILLFLSTVHFSVSK